MDLRQLRYFVGIADAGSFTEAAARLFVAQSALSRHMQALEDAMGGPLFERGARGVVLTDSGAVLLRHARFILSQIEDSKAEVQALNGEVRGTVRLAMPSSLGQLLFVPLVNHFLDGYPKIHLALSEGTTNNVVHRLRDGTVDVGIVTNPALDPQLEFAFLAREPLVLMGRTGDPLLQRARISPARLRALPLMAAGGLLSLLAPYVQDLVPRVQVESTLPIKSLVVAGRGYAVVPASSMLGDSHAGQLQCTQLEGVHLDRMIATHKGRPTGRAARTLIQYLHDHTGAMLGQSRTRSGRLEQRRVHP